MKQIKFLSKFWGLFWQDLLTGDDASRPAEPIGNQKHMQFGASGERIFGDEYADMSRDENYDVGELNYRTGRFDNGSDPHGLYEDDID